jgi:hypothetical protein
MIMALPFNTDIEFPLVGDNTTHGPPVYPIVELASSIM